MNNSKIKENKMIQYVLKKVGKALGNYEMLKNEDNILVALSGGKDSLALIDILKEKQKKLPFKFNIFAATIDYGFIDPESQNSLKSYLESINIKYFFIKKSLPKSEKKFSCFWCSWNRRKEIFLLAKELNCKKVAFGHNLDDVIVTFLMNLFYHGEISTMPAKIEMFKGEIVIIRPLVYVSSEETKRYAELKNLPVVDNRCPYYKNDKFQQRKYLENIVEDLQKYYPNIKLNIFNSLKKIKLEYLV
ncbi:MAG: ATP-binding protein [Endomicrobiia bacterium]